jgi:hypothetical protein
MILGNGPGRLGLDIFMVTQKFPHNGRTVGIFAHKETSGERWEIKDIRRKTGDIPKTGLANQRSTALSRPRHTIPPTQQNFNFVALGYWADKHGEIHHFATF